VQIPCIYFALGLFLVSIELLRSRMTDILRG
jgi:hypothetical protein